MVTDNTGTDSENWRGRVPRLELFIALGCSVLVRGFRLGMIWGLFLQDRRYCVVMPNHWIASRWWQSLAKAQESFAETSRRLAESEIAIKQSDNLVRAIARVLVSASE